MTRNLASYSKRYLTLCGAISTALLLTFGAVSVHAKEAATAKPIAAPAKASATSTVPQKFTSVEGITEYRLPNGLKVLLFPDASKPTVTVNVTYLVGSRNENYGETGMAHLLEHLVFKGTPKNPDIDKNFNKRGMRFNGTTWLDPLPFAAPIRDFHHSIEIAENNWSDPAKWCR